jgi:hypothetical protein
MPLVQEEKYQGKGNLRYEMVMIMMMMIIIMIIIITAKYYLYRNCKICSTRDLIFQARAPGYGLNDREFESRQGLRIFLFTTASKPTLGPT